MKNKKGSARDLFFLITFIFGLAFAFFVAYQTWNEISTALISSDIGTVQEAVDAMDEVTVAISKIDYYYMLAFIFLTIGMMVSSFLVDFHPIFYVVFVISWVMAVVVGTILSIVYNTMILDNYFSTMPTIMPFAAFILDYLPWVTTILGFLLVIVMFVKTKQPGYGTV